MKSKGVWITLAAIVLVLVLLPLFAYNGLISAQEAALASSADLDAQLQRRMDLIPNLVSVVQRYTDHEAEVFSAVATAREKLLAADGMAEKAAASDELSASLTRLVAVAEAYPALTADTLYVGLMDELAGTENRVTVARTRYNEAATAYNAKLRAFPGIVIAKLLGFQRAPLFSAQEGAETAPEVRLR